MNTKVPHKRTTYAPMRKHMQIRTLFLQFQRFDHTLQHSLIPIWESVKRDKPNNGGDETYDLFILSETGCNVILEKVNASASYYEDNNSN